MITLFRPIRERSNLGRRRKKNEWLTGAVTAEGLLFCLKVLNKQVQNRLSEERRKNRALLVLFHVNVVFKDCSLPSPCCLFSLCSLRCLLGAVVNDNVFLRSASDGIVMLEEGNRPSRIHQQGIIRDRIAPFHASMSSVGNCQAVEDLGAPEQRLTNC